MAHVVFEICKRASYRQPHVLIAYSTPVNLGRSNTGGVWLRICAAEPDMERVFHLPSITYVGGDDKCLPLREIIRRLGVPAT